MISGPSEQPAHWISAKKSIIVAIREALQLNHAELLAAQALLQSGNEKTH